MILYELLNKLQTSVYRCMLMSPGSCDMPVDNMAGPTNSTGRKVREKNYPTCFALLDVGIMTILRRTDNYILIWPRNPVSLNSTTVIFQNCPSSQTKLLRSLAFAAMLFFETMPLWSFMVGLIQLPNFYEGDLLSGSWALWVSRVEGVQGFLWGSWLQRSNESKISTISRVLGSKVQGLTGLKG